MGSHVSRRSDLHETVALTFRDMAETVVVELRKPDALPQACLQPGNTALLPAGWKALPSPPTREGRHYPERYLSCGGVPFRFVLESDEGR